MDHHCPWINNCVGLYTKKPFLLFMVYVMLGSVVSFALVIKNGIKCFILHPIRRTHEQTLGLVFLSRFPSFSLGVLGVVLALLFFIFTAIMFYETMQILFASSSKIDLKQGNKFKEVSQSLILQVSWMECLVEIFGCRPHLSWLVPTLINERVVVEHEYKALVANIQHTPTESLEVDSSDN